MDKALLAEQRGDCFIRRDGYWFRLRATAVILRNGCVLMVKNERDPYYYSVGGAVMLGESLEDAVRREVLEETGIPMEIDRLLFIHENFFIGGDQERCHEVAFYYLMKTPAALDIHADSHSMDGVREHMVWLPIAEYAAHNAYPRFFKDHLDPLPAVPQHICSWEDDREVRHAL